jgi:hypothetical protein
VSDQQPKISDDGKFYCERWLPYSRPTASSESLVPANPTEWTVFADRGNRCRSSGQAAPDTLTATSRKL